MPGTLTLRVLTESGLAMEDEATSVIAPGVVGYLGVLHNHAPLVTPLVPGKLTWKRQDGSQRTAKLGPGLLEILHNRLTILVDSFSLNA